MDIPPFCSGWKCDHSSNSPSCFFYIHVCIICTYRGISKRDPLSTCGWTGWCCEVFPLFSPLPGFSSPIVARARWHPCLVPWIPTRPTRTVLHERACSEVGWGYIQYSAVELSRLALYPALRRGEERLSLRLAIHRQVHSHQHCYKPAVCCSHAYVDPC